MSEELKKTSKEWLEEIPEEHGLVIMDPDGWDRKNYKYSFNEELITKKEFMKRLSYSTTICKTSFHEYFEEQTKEA